MVQAPGEPWGYTAGPLESAHGHHCHVCFSDDGGESGAREKNKKSAIHTRHSKSPKAKRAQEESIRVSEMKWRGLSKPAQGYAGNKKATILRESETHQGRKVRVAGMSSESPAMEARDDHQRGEPSGAFLLPGSWRLPRLQTTGRTSGAQSYSHGEHRLTGESPGLPPLVRGLLCTHGTSSSLYTTLSLNLLCNPMR